MYLQFYCYCQVRGFTWEDCHGNYGYDPLWLRATSTCIYIHSFFVTAGNFKIERAAKSEWVFLGYLGSLLQCEQTGKLNKTIIPLYNMLFLPLLFSLMSMICNSLFFGLCTVPVTLLYDSPFGRQSSPLPSIFPFPNYWQYL